MNKFHPEEDREELLIYLGPSRRFEEGKGSYEGRFVSQDGIIVDIDPGLVWIFEVM
jgi:hypothetical protein